MSKPSQSSREEAILKKLDAVIAEKRCASPNESYVASLFDKGLNKILEKVGEEATETIIAAKELQQQAATSPEDQSKSRSDLISEVSDLWFHTLVALGYFDISSSEVLAELQRRFGLSGLTEKASRQEKD